MDAAADEIVAFWRAAGQKRWFSRDDGFDDEFRSRFMDLHLAAARRELDGWMDEPEGALALLILLDQFPRNCFRGTAHMYATDALALSLARRAVQSGLHEAVDPELRMFFVMPFIHSESLADQERAVALCQGLGEDTADSASEHRDIIARFGRFPHRNPMLGRETTPDERRFLEGGGFSG